MFLTYVFLVAPWTQIVVVLWVLLLCGRCPATVALLASFCALRPLTYCHVCIIYDVTLARWRSLDDAFFPPLWRHYTFNLNYISNSRYFSSFSCFYFSCTAYLYLSCVSCSSCYPASVLNCKSFSPLRSKVSLHDVIVLPVLLIWIIYLILVTFS